MASAEYCVSFHQCVLGFFLLGLTTPISADDVTLVSIGRDVPAERLTCWICQHSRSTPNTNCVSMGNKTEISQATCNLMEPFCRVRKLMKDAHVELFERSCTHTCDPGCETKVNKVQACTSCCVHQLCNTGSSANTVVPQFAMLVTSVVLTQSIWNLIWI